MAAQGTNPVILTAANDRFNRTCKIAAIVWESASTSGDTVHLVKNSDSLTLWKGRTDTTQTYQGIVFDAGIPCDGGFSVAQISSGTVLVYLKNDL